MVVMPLNVFAPARKRLPPPVLVNPAVVRRLMVPALMLALIRRSAGGAPELTSNRISALRIQGNG
jgi:hypothetical protein